MEETISVREYARLRGLTLHTVYMKLWAGQLNGVKMYGRWQIIASDNRTDEGGCNTSEREFTDCIGVAEVIADGGKFSAPQPEAVDAV